MKNKNDMLTRLDLIQEALQKTNVHSWLFYNVFHRDSIADDILFVPKNNMNTRPWFFIVPNIGPPLKIVHLKRLSFSMFDISGCYKNVSNMCNK